MHRYHLLMMKDGRVLVGTRGNPHDKRHGWAYMDENGSFGCVADREVFSSTPIKPPKRFLARRQELKEKLEKALSELS